MATEFAGDGDTADVRLRPRGSTPTSLRDGDLWSDSTGQPFFRVNSVTLEVLFVEDVGSAAYEDTAAFASSSHASSHTNGTDDIQSATSGQKGLATAAQITKLDGIESGADVTDATNVDAAGAVMNSDASTAAMSFVLDEDDMVSDSATKVPTQQSVKAYVDANGGGVTVLTVANIDDPSTELNAIAGSSVGELRLCVQENATADNSWTLYAWDDSAQSESVPYTVDGSSGQWQAIAGRRLADALRINGGVFPTAIKVGGVGATVLEFSTDGTLAGDSDTAVPTEKAVKTYVDANGGGILAQQTTVQDTTNRSTTSSTLTASGVSASLTAGANGRKYRVRAHGIIGSSNNGMDMAVTIYRQINGGAATDLTPGGTNAMVQCRSISSDDDGHAIPFSIEIEDSPAASNGDTVAYLLYFKTNAGTVYLGRRGLNTDYDCPTTMVVEELIP